MPFSRRNIATVLARVVSTAALLAGFVPGTNAQQYTSDPVDVQIRNNNRAAVVAAVNGNFAANRDKVIEYFSKYFFPAMTQYDAANLEKLGAFRYSLLRDYLWRTSSAELQRELTQLTMSAMQGIATKPYHPAVRYNAVLVIGMLDAEYAIDQGANRRPPKPLPEANAFLVLIVKSAAEGKAVPPVLLAGALVGLERHARFRDGLPRDAVANMTSALLKIAMQDKPILDVRRDVFAWVRLKAAGILADLGSPGPNNQVHDALVKLVGDGRTIDDRCSAAALFAKINYEGAKVDGTKAGVNMLALAGEVATAELKRAEDFREKRFAGGGGAIMMERESFRGEGGPAYSGEQPEDYPRRHLLTRLSELRAGLSSLKPVVPADTQQKFDAVNAALGPVIDAAANKDTVSLNVANAVVAMANAITAVTGTTPAAAAAEDVAGFEEPATGPENGGAAPATGHKNKDTEPDTTPPAAAAPNRTTR